MKIKQTLLHKFSSLGASFVVFALLASVAIHAQAVKPMMSGGGTVGNGMLSAEDEAVEQAKSGDANSAAKKAKKKQKLKKKLSPQKPSKKEIKKVESKVEGT